MVVPKTTPDAIVTVGAAARGSTGCSAAGAAKACGMDEHSARRKMSGEKRRGVIAGRESDMRTYEMGRT